MLEQRMEFKLPYLLAMREHAPKMFNELRRSGALDEHVAMKAKEAYSIYQSLIAGAETLPNGIPRDLQVMRSAEEQTLAVMLDFPDESAMGLKGLAVVTEIENAPRIADVGTDEEQSKLLAQLSRLETLVRRPFAELSHTQKDELGKLHAERGNRMAQAIVDNLNRNVMAREEASEPVLSELTSIDYRANDMPVTKDQIEFRDPNDLNSRIDPEIFVAGMQLVMHHIEQGRRRFKDLAKAVAQDLDVPVASIRRYLRGWYNGARDTMEDTGESLVSMDSTKEDAGFMRRLDDWSATPTFASTKQKQMLTTQIEFPDENVTEPQFNPQALSPEMKDYLHDPDAAFFRAMEKRKKLKEEFPNLSSREIFHKMFPK